MYRKELVSVRFRVMVFIDDIKGKVQARYRFSHYNSKYRAQNCYIILTVCFFLSVQNYLNFQLVDALVGEDPADHNDIVLEVTAGVGGQEAMLFCSELLHMYYKYATHKGWTISSIMDDKSETGIFFLS